MKDKVLLSAALSSGMAAGVVVLAQLTVHPQTIPALVFMVVVVALGLEEERLFPPRTQVLVVAAVLEDTENPLRLVLMALSSSATESPDAPDRTNLLR